MAALAAAGVALIVLAAGTGRARRFGEAPWRRRPAAADTSGIRFEELTADQSGLRFRWNEHPRRPLRTLDAFGCGCALLDYDGDGRQDILLVNEPISGLFRNSGGGRFQDVTGRVGLDTVRGAWKGVAVGDYDGDGWLDLFLTGYRCLALLRSRKGAGFTDMTRAAGLAADNWRNWGASAGFMDLDADGDLDLVMLNYVVWGPHAMQYCTYGGIRMGCPPKVYDPERGRLFRNNGDGTFADVSHAAGFSTTHGVGLVVAFADADEDGRIDFYLGNDAIDADFMKNLGGLRFRNVALENGTAYGKNGKALASMAADWADFNRDGHLDLTATDFSNASFALFLNDGSGTFSNEAAAVGLAAATYRPLGFGAKFADVDNDGWPDIFYVNGHVYDRVAETDPALSFRSPAMLFRSEEGRRLTDLAPLLGGGLARPILGRGSAAGDLDNDGRLDLLAVDYEGEPLLLRNVSETANHWVTLDLRASGTNHFAYGARVTVRCGGRVSGAVLSPASSYLSSSDPRLHFGLGRSPRIDSLTIRWPSGRTEVLRDVPADGILVVTEQPGASATISPAR